MYGDLPRTKRRKTAIAPMLSVRNGVKAIEFYKAAFGADELFRLDDENGAVVAQLSVAGAKFWLADESRDHLSSPESLGGGSVRMVMIVPEPDEGFDRAVTAGAKVVSPVNNQPYGWRVGRVVDPFGHHWEIGKPLAEGFNKGWLLPDRWGEILISLKMSMSAFA